MRKSTVYKTDDPAVPQALFDLKPQAPDLEGFPYPLPCAKKEYTCFAEGEGVIWYGSPKGLTKYDKNAEYNFDRIMYYSADRDLPDNNIKAILPDGRNA